MFCCSRIVLGHQTLVIYNVQGLNLADEFTQIVDSFCGNVLPIFPDFSLIMFSGGTTALFFQKGRIFFLRFYHVKKTIHSVRLKQISSSSGT